LLFLDDVFLARIMLFSSRYMILWSSAINEKYREHLERQRRRYSRPRDVWSKVERHAFGRDVGLNGYTSPSEAKDLVEFVGVPGPVLDLGSGGGWPGKKILIKSEQRLVVAMDIVLDGLQESQRGMADTGDDERFRCVAGDGQSLPFAAESFGLVLHADALC
jgi:SAM-dependent methyltransferase